jgi:hypothetical protein
MVVGMIAAFHFHVKTLVHNLFTSKVKIIRIRELENPITTYETSSNKHSFISE